MALPQLAALVLMLATEPDPAARIGFLLAWGLLNFFWLALVRRPALAGLLALAVTVQLVLLSRLEHDILQIAANFVDLMVIDQDTVAFLLRFFPASKARCWRR